MTDVYNEDWYLRVTAPGAKIWQDGEGRFAYQEVNGKAISPYGYAGITGDPQRVRNRLGMPLFIRYGVDQRASGCIERPTRVIPLADPWHTGSPHLAESRRAQRLGITARNWGTDLGAIRHFQEGYRSAMTSKEAPEKYFIIGDLLEEWAGNPQVHVVLSEHAGAIFLTGSTWAHYHLSFRRPTAHNTEMHAIFDVGVPACLQAGCQFMHLGGGTTPKLDDPLYKFKSRLGRIPHTVCFQEIP